MKREVILSPGFCFWFLSFVWLATTLPTNQSIDVNGHRFSKTSTSPDLNTVCVHNEVVYARGENFTTDDPCKTCVCSPPGLECLVKTCQPTPGCKSIHVASRCCPESVCECEINGRIYSNGEKVEGPDPCKVCYCKGGDVKCALITCYSRDDCEAVHVEGRCCPKYDDCPPLESMKNKSASPQVVISDLPSSESDHSPKAEETTKMETTVSGAAPPSVPTLEIEEITGTAFFDATQFDARQMATTATSESGPSTEGDDGSETRKANGRQFHDLQHLDAKIGSGVKFNAPLNANPSAKTMVRDWLTDRDNSTTETIYWVREIEPNNASEDLNNGQANVEVENNEETVLGNSTPAEIPSRASANLRQKPPHVPPESTTSNPEEVGESSPSEPVFEESSAPGLKMLSAEQMQFLQVGEESPVYVDAPRASSTEASRPYVVVVVPSATPMTVKMMKVTEIKDSTKTSA